MNPNISKPQPTNIKQNINLKSPDEIKSTQIPHKELSSKNNIQLNAHNNNNNNQDNKKNQSQAQSHNFLDQIEINEKFFPQKTNYFISENNDKIKNSLQSPIIDYFSHTSNNYLQKFNSPEEIIDGNKNSNSNANTNTNTNTNANNNLNNKNSEQKIKTTPMAYNIELNFDNSPSNIFNCNFMQNTPSTNSLNNNNNTSNNNITLLQSTQSNEECATKTLQERIGLLVGKNDINNYNFNINRKNNVNPLSTTNFGFINNNFMNNDVVNINNNNNLNNNNYYNNTNTTQTNEDEEENNQEEPYILTFNSEDEKDVDDEVPNNNNANNANNMYNINNNNNNQNNNIENNINNNENINNFNDNNKNECIAKKVLIKKEMPKPYIPNRFRNNEQQLNSIINSDENKLPSYGGAIYNIEKNNKNMNINNNMILNNNLNQNIIINSSPLQNNGINNGNINTMTSTTNNIFYPIMNNNFIYSPMNMNYGFFSYGYPNNDNYINNNYNNNQNANFYFPQKIGEFMNFPMRKNQENNKFTNFNKISNNSNNFENNNNKSKNINNFYYNGDQYQISSSQQYKSSNDKYNNDEANFDFQKNNNFSDYKNNNMNQEFNNGKEKIYTIGTKDLVTTITSNNKKIKRINPKAYLNESYEYLSHNIFALAKDQAGCRFLQEKLEKEPKIATKYFYDAILPYILPLVKDPFGNYLIQKLCETLDNSKIKKILEIMAPTILDIGANSHGTRVIQQIINYLRTKELLNYFLEMIKPFVIPLLKELNGTHIIQKLLNEHPETGECINKIIVENCSSLATHRHGCCVLQKFLDGPYKKLKYDLIQNLINNCLVLIIDQFGNYVIQSILLLKEKKACSEIALKICDNVPYYSKHRYSSNVVEKCFDYCSEEEKKMFVEKLCPPEILAELILDDHGNYVIQKALQCAEGKIKENMLKSIIPLIPKIKEVSFGERLLSKLYSNYPQLNINSNVSNKNNNSNIFEDKNKSKDASYANNNNNGNEGNYKKNNNMNNKRGIGNNGRGGKNNNNGYYNKNKFNDNSNINMNEHNNEEWHQNNVNKIFENDENEINYKYKKSKNDLVGRKKTK